MAYIQIIECIYGRYLRKMLSASLALSHASVGAVSGVSDSPLTF